MRNIINCIVLALVFVLLYCVYSSSVQGQEIKAYKTREGNYMLFKNGKIAGYVSKLPSGNIVVKDYYAKTRKSKSKPKNTRRSTPKIRASRPPHMTSNEYDEMLRRWRMSRLAAIKAGGMYWWELMYPSVFHR